MVEKVNTLYIVIVNAMRVRFTYQKLLWFKNFTIYITL